MEANEVRDKIVKLWEGLKLDDYRYTDSNPTPYTWLQDYAPATLDPNTAKYSAYELGSSVSPYNTFGYDAFVGDQSFIDTAKSDASRAIQLDNLNKWDALVKSGLTADEASAVKSVQDAAQTARARADASIRNDMIARGTAGSGSELAQRLAASQAASNLANDQGDQLSKLMIDRQNQALAASDNLASNVRTQDQSLAAQQAALNDSFQRNRETIINNARKYAVDQKNAASAWAAGENSTNSRMNATAINDARRYNAESDYRNASTNLTNKNNASLFNLTNRQGLANANIDMTNEAQQEKDNAYNSVVGLRNQQKYNTLTGYSNALNGVATGIDNATAAAQQNANAKTKGWIDLGVGTLNAVSGASSLVKTLFG